MQLLDGRAQVVHPAVGVGVLQQRAEHPVLVQVVQPIDDQLEAEALGAGLQYGQGLRVAMFIDEERIAARLGHAPCQSHGFGSGRRFVEQRGIGQVQPGQVDDHLLVIEQRLQATLGDLRLIRRIGGVPAGVLQHVAQDHRGRQGSVVPHADQAGPHLVLLGVTAQFCQGGLFIKRRGQFQRAVQANARRDGLLDQFTATAQAQGLQHRLLLGRIRAKMTTQERVGIVQLAQGRRLGHSGSLFQDQASRGRGLLSLGRDCRSCGKNYSPMAAL